jgi:hypothetical protein
VVEEEDGTTYVVFDVAHVIRNRRMVVLVSAREAARVDRFYVLSENGYLDTRGDQCVEDLTIVERQIESVQDRLPLVKEIPDPL